MTTKLIKKMMMMTGPTNCKTPFRCFQPLILKKDEMTAKMMVKRRLLLFRPQATPSMHSDNNNNNNMSSNCNGSINPSAVFPQLKIMPFINRSFFSPLTFSLTARLLQLFYDNLFGPSKRTISYECESNEYDLISGEEHRMMNDQNCYPIRVNTLTTSLQDRHVKKSSPVAASSSPAQNATRSKLTVDFSSLDEAHALINEKYQANRIRKKRERTAECVTLAFYNPNVKIDLCRLRQNCQLYFLPFPVIMAHLRPVIREGAFHRQEFTSSTKALLHSHDLHPVPGAIATLFDVLDRKRNGVVDVLELLCGIAHLCKGGREERLKGLFELFDEDGDGTIRYDEMIRLLLRIYRIMLTPSVMRSLRDAGLSATTVMELSQESTDECFWQLRDRAQQSSADRLQHKAKQQQQMSLADATRSEKASSSLTASPQSAATMTVSSQLDTDWQRPGFFGEALCPDRELSINFDDFREWCETTPTVIGFSRSSALRSPFVKVLEALLAPLHPDLKNCEEPVRRRSTLMREGNKKSGE